MTLTSSFPKEAWGRRLNNIPHHIPTSKLEEMRMIIDDTADDVLHWLDSLHKQIASSSQVNEFLNDIANQKNATLNMKVTNQPHCVKVFIDQVCSKPDWLDQKLINHGKLVFYRYYGAAAMGLLYFSLIGGFSAPKIIKVLEIFTQLIH